MSKSFWLLIIKIIQLTHCCPSPIKLVFFFFTQVLPRLLTALFDICVASDIWEENSLQRSRALLLLITVLCTFMCVFVDAMLYLSRVRACPYTVKSLLLLLLFFVHVHVFSCVFMYVFECRKLSPSLSRGMCAFVCVYACFCVYLPRSFSSAHLGGVQIECIRDEAEARLICARLCVCVFVFMRMNSC